MRIVAIGTSHFSGIDRMRGNPVSLRTLGLVAGEADLGLRHFLQNLVLMRVIGMATYAGNTSVIVLAGRPVHTVSTLVATGADFTLLARREFRFGTENNIDRTTLATDLTRFRAILDMRLAGPVTTLAPRRPTISLHAMPAFIDSQDRLVVIFIMTLGTDCIPLE